MPEPTPTPQFEDEIRAALETPPARPEFVSRLQSQLLQKASVTPARRAAPPWGRPFFLRPAWAAALVLTLALVAGTLVIGPQRIVSAFASLLGYIPDIGLVQNDGSLRLLDAPVQVEREGITLTVEQGAADPTHTVLIYRAEGLSLKAANSQGEMAAAGGPMVLLLPDGSFLSMTGAQMQGWGSGYQTRLVFPALPAGVNEATLLIYRLETMPAGVAPEDWRIPLKFKPAPADLKVMPVYELATAGTTPTASTPGSTEIAVSSPALATQATQNGITLTLDRVVELDAGYQFQGSASWDPKQYDGVMLNLFAPGSKFLTDSNGQPIPYEMTEDGIYHRSGSEITWSLHTRGKAFPGPWTLAIPTMGVEQPLNPSQAAFRFDFGPNPQVGQTWQLDQEIEAAGYKLHLTSASLGTNSRSQDPQITFKFETADDISFGLAEADPGAVSGSGMSRTGTQVEARLYYVKMPTGVHTIHIASISYGLDGPWQVSWNPPTATPTLSNQSTQNGITLSLDRVAELEDGYLLQGKVTWDPQRYSGVMLDVYGSQGHALTAGNGLYIPFELADPSGENTSASGLSTPWALRTNSKTYQGPWTLTVPSVQVFQALKTGQSAFPFDFGSDPQFGQTWQIDREIEVAGHPVRLLSASLEQDSRSQSPVIHFNFEATSDVDGLVVYDPANVPEVSGQTAGAGGGGMLVKPGQIEASIAYYKKPSGVRTIQVESIVYSLSGPWQVSWDPPAAAGQPTPPPAPRACFDSLKWQQVQEGAPVKLPEGLSGRLLLETNTGQLMPQMTLVNPDGSQPQEIAIGGWSDLSPDGSTVAFIKSNGPSLFLADVRSGEIRPVPNTISDDYHPVWFPDGQWLAFVRSLDGIYVIHPDGTGLKQVLGPANVAFLVGFTPDAQRLVVTILGAGGSQVQTVDIQTGKAANLFTIANAKGGFALLSPDGTHIAFNEMAFGLPSYGIYVAALDGSDKHLVAGMETGGASVNAWSPDGKWLALTVMQFDGAQETETPVLLNLDTCQAYPVPGLSGRIVTWR